MEALRTASSSAAAQQGRAGWKYLSPLDERRRSSREPVKAKGLVSAKESRYGGEQEGQLVEVADLTLHGVGFHSPVAYEPGDLRSILVMAGPLRLSSRFRVVSCRADASGSQFEVGGEFC